MTDELAEAMMGDLRNRLLHYLDEHSRLDHAGAVCPYERVNTIAWLCHAIGVGPEHLDVIKTRMEFYDKVCPCGVRVPVPTEEECRQ